MALFKISFLNPLLANFLAMLPKAFIKPFAKRYVAGETMQEMLEVARAFQRQGIYSTIDVLGEFIHQPEEAVKTAALYRGILETFYNDPDQLYRHANISVKLTALGLNLDEALCYQLMRELLASAKACHNFVRIDMEDSACTEKTIQIYLKLREEFDNVGIVLQAYLKRTQADALEIMKKNAGHFRLCKGIYVEPQAIAYKSQREIHQNYLTVLNHMLIRNSYVGIATHHLALIEAALGMIEKYQLRPEQYEFQMLLGVAPELRTKLRQGGHKVRVYVPFGKDWYAYSIRRLKENPAIISHILKNLFIQS